MVFPHALDVDGDLKILLCTGKLEGESTCLHIISFIASWSLVLGLSSPDLMLGLEP